MIDPLNEYLIDDRICFRIVDFALPSFIASIDSTAEFAIVRQRQKNRQHIWHDRHAVREGSDFFVAKDFRDEIARIRIVRDRHTDTRTEEKKEKIESRRREKFRRYLITWV